MKEIGMNIGHLKNQSFVNEYKNFGFSTRNQMIDEALELLKKTIKKKQRAKWREEAHNDYAKSTIEYVWNSIDGEDFENT
jgi:hypothetical protein